MSATQEKLRLLLKLFTPQRRQPDPRYALPEADRDLTGRVIVFTGGTDGMGRVAVGMLSEMGADLIILGRSAEKGAALLADLAAQGGRGTARFERCDFTMLQDVAECAERIRASCPRIDALVNCAGVNAMRQTPTGDGFAPNWSVNYLAPMLLTRRLLDRLAAGARIVNLTTDTAYLDHLDIDLMETAPDLGFTESYAASKLALEIASVDLAERLQDAGITVNLQHPGYIRSNLLRHLRGPARLLQAVMRAMASPSEVGADRIVRLVASRALDTTTGALFAEDTRRPHHPDVADLSKRARLLRRTDQILSRWDAP